MYVRTIHSPKGSNEINEIDENKSERKCRLLLRQFATPSLRFYTRQSIKNETLTFCKSVTVDGKKINSELTDFRKKTASVSCMILRNR